MLEIEHVQKYYKTVPILEDISFSLPSSGVASFVGPNGSGKTTLLSCISGFLQPTSGHIIIDGKTVHSSEDSYGHVSFFSNETILIDELTGYDHLKLLNSTQRETANYYVDLFHAHSFLKKKVKKYSLGMKQILIIILTLSIDAPLLIFDEALNGLDPKNRQLMMNEIKKLKEKKLILFSSHILHDVIELSDVILFLNNGLIEAFPNDSNLNLTELYMKRVGGGL